MYIYIVQLMVTVESKIVLYNEGAFNNRLCSKTTPVLSSYVYITNAGESFEKQ